MTNDSEAHRNDQLSGETANTQGTSPIPRSKATRNVAWAILTILVVGGLVYIVLKIPSARLVTGVIGVAIMAAFTLWRVPKWQVSNLADLSRSDLFEQENEARRTLAQIIGGVVLLGGLFYTAENIRVAQRTQDLTRQGQITDRFTKAVDQLGKADQEGTLNNLAIRLGGIYALERISKESQEDYWPIMELLTAFARENAGFRDHYRKEHLSEIRPDISAIIVVLGRRKLEYEAIEQHLDLRRTNLSYCITPRGNFEKALFDDSDLTNAVFDGADMAGASFSDAALQSAHFNGADLKRALFYPGTLDIFEGVDLKNPSTWPEAARNRSPIFDRTDLRGADLTGAVGLRCDDIRSARIDSGTKLPTELQDCSGTHHQTH